MADLEIRAADGSVRAVPILGDVLTIGSAPNSGLKLDDPEAPACWLEIVDLNGFFALLNRWRGHSPAVNGVRCERAQLHDGDVIEVSSLTLVFRQGAQPEACASDEGARVVVRGDVCDQQDLPTRLDTEVIPDTVVATLTQRSGLPDNTFPRPLAPKDYEVGRDPRTDLVLQDFAVSDHHLRLVWRGHGFDFSDLGSRNGTFLNGHRLSNGTLRHGDRLRLGTTEIEYHDGLSEGPALRPAHGGALRHWLEAPAVLLIAVATLAAASALGVLLILPPVRDEAPKPREPMFECAEAARRKASLESALRQASQEVDEVGGRATADLAAMVSDLESRKPVADTPPESATLALATFADVATRLDGIASSAGSLLELCPTNPSLGEVRTRAQELSGSLEERKRDLQFTEKEARRKAVDMATTLRRESLAKSWEAKLASGQFSVVLAEFDSLTIEGGDRDAPQLAALASQARSRDQEARRNAEGRLATALSALDMRQWSKAYSAASDAIRADPSNRYGVATRATEVRTRAAAPLRASASPRLQAANSMLDQGNLKAAAAELRAALRTFPDYGEASQQLGNVVNRMKVESQNLFDKAQIYASMGNSGRAKEQYEKILELYDDRQNPVAVKAKRALSGK